MFHSPYWSERKRLGDTPAPTRTSEFFSTAKIDEAADVTDATPGNQALLRHAGGLREPRAERPSQSFTLPTWRITPIDAGTAANLIPRDGVSQDEDDAAPNGGGGADGGPAPGPAPGPTPAPIAEEADTCNTPRSFHKVTSGAFQAGLDITSYYPDLAARGYPATAGPFDLGNRAGSAVQLFGVIPSPCQPAQFTLSQMATASRWRKNGVSRPEEGTTFNDIARSRRNATVAPFRQEFLGGGTAPLGYIISMADPPSMSYNASITAGEYDISFVTSLVGPGGSKSVSWSISVRIVNGAVTRNTVS